MTKDKPTRETWLAERQSGIGASDAPAVLGISPWKSAFELWSEKAGLAEPEDLSENEAVEFGLRLEPVIGEAFADRTGRTVEMCQPFEVQRHDSVDFMLCTPDAVQFKPEEPLDDGNLQIKTASAFKSSEWKDEPPLYYQVQVQHELAVTGQSWATLVVLIGGQRLRYFDVERNDAFIDAMIPKLEEFWGRVKSGTPPEPDGSVSTSNVLAKLYPLDDGDSISLPLAANEWDTELLDVKSQLKELEQRKRELENQLKAAIGTASFGLLADGTTYSLKAQTRAEYVCKETTFRVLRRRSK